MWRAGTRIFLQITPAAPIDATDAPPTLVDAGFRFPRRTSWRILDHLEQYLVDNPAARIHEIAEAVGVLATKPLIGRPAENGKRELLIGRRTHGYVGRYRYVAEIDTVFVLAIRAQR